MYPNRLPQENSTFSWQPLENFDRTNAAVMEFELKNASTTAESTDEDDDANAVA